MRKLTHRIMVEGIIYEPGTAESDIVATPGELKSLIDVGVLADADAVDADSTDDRVKAPQKPVPAEASEQPASDPKPSRRKSKPTA